MIYLLCSSSYPPHCSLDAEENSVKNDFQVFLDAARRGEEGKQNHSLHVYYLFGRALLSVSLAKINYEKSRAVQGKFMAWEEEQEEELGFVT
jgi:hypothetical protein